jgi:hypothetical protein
VSGLRWIVLFGAGTAIGVVIAVAGDLAQVRGTARATAEGLAAAPHDIEERQLARDIARYLHHRKDLDRRAKIVSSLPDAGALRRPAPTIDRLLDWADQHGIEVNDLVLSQSTLQVLVATADPRVAITLAHDLVGLRLIASPEITWSRPLAGKGPRWLAVTGRVVLPRQQRALGPGVAAGAR